MRGIVIDPWRREVREIEIARGLEAMYAALSTEGQLGDVPFKQECWCVDRFAIGKSPVGGERLDVWFDDNGMDCIEQAAFWRFDNTHPIAGMALILGHNGEGGTIGTTLLPSLVKRAVRWLPFGPYPPERPSIVVGYNDPAMRRFLP